MRRPSPVEGARLVGALAGAALAAWVATAHGEMGSEGPEGALERGRALVEDLRYSQAVEELEVVAANESAPVRTRLQALEVLGVLHASRDQERAAREAFEWLLTLDPGHSLSDPLVTAREEEFFMEVRDSFRPEITATLEVAAPEVAPRGSPLRLEATLGGDTSSVVAVAVYHRQEDEVAFSRVAMSCSGASCTAELPDPRGEAVLYYVEAQAPSGYALASTGTLEEPRRIEGIAPPRRETEPVDDAVEREPAGPSADRWYTSWWFWTIVGAVVVAGAATAVALSVPAEAPPDGNLGSLHLP